MNLRILEVFISILPQCLKQILTIVDQPNWFSRNYLFNIIYLKSNALLQDDVNLPLWSPEMFLDLIINFIYYHFSFMVKDQHLGLITF